MRFLTILFTVILVNVSLQIHYIVAIENYKYNSSNTLFVISYKNSLANHEFLKNSYRYMQIRGVLNELTKKYPNFDKDREAIQKETGGGEGKIYKLVEKYPELKPYEETLLEINYAHAPDSQVIEWLKGIKAKGYTVYMFDNVAPDTLKTWQMRYSEVFQYIDKIITVPEDLKTLKTPHPYLYNVLKNEAYGEDETCDLNIHREISQDIIEKHKKMIFVTNQGKLECGLQAKLPIVASYI